MELSVVGPGMADEMDKNRLEKARQLDQRGETQACIAEIERTTRNADAFGRQ